MVNWLEPSQENFYFKKEVVNINQCLMGGILGININIYWRLIKCWSQSSVLCGKVTKLREAALQHREGNPSYHLLISPSQSQAPTSSKDPPKSPPSPSVLIKSNTSTYNTYLEKSMLDLWYMWTAHISAPLCPNSIHILSHQGHPSPVHLPPKNWV